MCKLSQKPVFSRGHPGRGITHENNRGRRLSPRTGPGVLVNLRGSPLSLAQCFQRLVQVTGGKHRKDMRSPSVISKAICPGRED